MDLDTIKLIASFAGMAAGPFIGTWFGMRTALNGLKERSVRMEGTLDEIRDYTRDSYVIVRRLDDERPA